LPENTASLDTWTRRLPYFTGHRQVDWSFSRDRPIGAAARRIDDDTRLHLRQDCSDAAAVQRVPSDT
jgi:hypothetical protein